MKVHLAAIAELKKEFEQGLVIPEDMFALESFYSMPPWELQYIPRFASFLLDSGAFTFMNATNKHGSVDWLSYADRFADFIKDNHIKHYFELDIDSIKGLSYVEMLRRRIEARCGVQAIPVWHISRKKDYFLGMVKDYPYVSVGGIVTKEIPRWMYERLFPWFISTAHKAGTKIHGLGYTDTIGLHKYRFDSVDSTTWTVSRRFGEVSIFRNNNIERITKKSDTKRIKDTTKINWFSFCEWRKFQKYAEYNL